ncbi:Ferredoxin C 2, chloroplastic-like protein [Drosera capensis]
MGIKSALGRTAKEMELLQPLCSFRTPLQLFPPFPGRSKPPSNFVSTCAFSHPNNSPKHKPPRPTAIAKLQTPAADTALTGPSSTSASPLAHKVTVHDRQRGLTHEFLVPEDQYILHTAEDQNIALPFACRHGCCTSCAVRIKSGEIRQPEALGISAELKCTGFSSGDTLLEDRFNLIWNSSHSHPNRTTPSASNLSPSAVSAQSSSSPTVESPIARDSHSESHHRSRITFGLGEELYTTFFLGFAYSHLKKPNSLILLVRRDCKD